MKCAGSEPPLRCPELLGRASLPRPPGSVLCFPAVSLGEGMVAIPVIVELLQRRPEYRVLMTTAVLSAFEVIKDYLPFFLAVHKSLFRMHHDIFTIIVSCHPQHGRELFEKLKRECHCIYLRSKHDKLLSRSNIYVVDTLGELRRLCKLAPVAIVGGSFFPDLSGHNLSVAAAAGCAVLSALRRS
ncbi:hypothetical protein MLD38_019595 [Melastoma candidum]|uniref:Uncharacterized protein n=1 Tax=Melastoma candidum TaxID=119954 RepID=A0ACB9QYK5_9MYRT|nr:hypothetical protein MLD38_019595 [Melastoma candidum]